MPKPNDLAILPGDRVTIDGEPGEFVAAETLDKGVRMTRLERVEDTKESCANCGHWDRANRRLTNPDRDPMLAPDQGLSTCSVDGSYTVAGYSCEHWSEIQDQDSEVPDSAKEWTERVAATLVSEIEHAFVVTVAIAGNLIGKSRSKTTSAKMAVSARATLAIALEPFAPTGRCANFEIRSVDYTDGTHRLVSVDKVDTGASIASESSAWSGLAERIAATGFEPIPGFCFIHEERWLAGKTTHRDIVRLSVHLARLAREAAKE